MPKNQAKRRLIGFFFLSILVSLLVGGAPVEGASLPPGIVVGDTEGFYVTNEGDYFIDLQGVMPGDVFTKEISIRNVNLKEGFEVGLQVAGGTGKGPIDFTKVVEVELFLNGTSIYKGGLLGSSEWDWAKKPLVLGFYPTGAESTLKATFTVSSKLGKDDYKEASEYKFKWRFSATAKPKEETKTSESKTIQADDKGKTIGFLPKTGEQWENFLYRSCAGLFLVVLVILLYKKRQAQQNN